MVYSLKHCLFSTTDTGEEPRLPVADVGHAADTSGVACCSTFRDRETGWCRSKIQQLQPAEPSNAAWEALDAAARVQIQRPKAAQRAKHAGQSHQVAALSEVKRL